MADSIRPVGSFLNTGNTAKTPPVGKDNNPISVFGDNDNVGDNSASHPPCLKWSTPKAPEYDPKTGITKVYPSICLEEGEQIESEPLIDSTIEPEYDSVPEPKNKQIPDLQEVVPPEYDPDFISPIEDGAPAPRIYSI